MNYKKETLLKKYPSRLPHSIWYRYNDKVKLSYCHPLKKKPYILVLKGTKADLWSRLDGKKSIEEIKKLFGNGISDRKIIKDLESLSYKGLIFLRDKPKRRLNPKEKKLLYYLNIVRSISKELVSSRFLKRKEQDSSQYHIHKIKDPYHQFNQIERTVSHTFFKAHPVLSVPYGVRLRQKLEKIKPLSKDVKILEVGGGIGWLSRRLLDNLRKTKPSIYKNLRYTFLDLSLSLLKSQRKLNCLHKNTSFFQAHGEYLPFKENSFDYIIANEIIADFRVIRLNKDVTLSKTKGFPKEAWQIIQKYKINIDDAPKQFIFNIGAIKFLEEIKRVLKPDGLAMVIEYGYDWFYPISGSFRGHKEHSIYFRHLCSVAESMGLKVQVNSLLKFLKFRRNIKVLQKCSSCLLRHLLRKRRKELHHYLTPTMFKEHLNTNYRDFKNIQFCKIDEGKDRLNLRSFKVMTLRKMK